MGSPEFAVPSLESLVLSQHQVVAVHTQPDRPAGRGRALLASPVKRAAAAWKLPVVQPVSLKRPEAVAELAGFRPDLIVVAAFGQILPRSVLELPRYGCLNVHPSLLPRFRGASPVAAAILAGDEFTGVSIMLLDEGLDTGPLLARAQLPVADIDTTDSLGAKLARLGAQLLLEVLPRWLKGEIIPRPQDEARASYAGPISKTAGEIDWRLAAVAIWRRVRACQPWPGAYTRWQGRRLEILEAVPLSGEEAAPVGRVVALAGEEKAPAFGVATGDGVLGIIRLKLEGKQALGAADFLRGQRDFVGAQLGLS
ncbi:MAG: methionyl-tRNA formyltransferase [Dehalococcoidales bacterium]|nr:methionyl-tRNA formyltransferase [Dehalococcoidales bacterium]